MAPDPMKQRFGNTNARKNHIGVPKTCTCCREFKAAGEFSIYKGKTLHSWCKVCQNAAKRLSDWKRRQRENNQTVADGR